MNCSTITSTHLNNDLSYSDNTPGKLRRQATAEFLLKLHNIEITADNATISSLTTENCLLKERIRLLEQDGKLSRSNHQFKLTELHQQIKDLQTETTNLSHINKQYRSLLTTTEKQLEEATITCQVFRTQQHKLQTILQDTQYRLGPVEFKSLLSIETPCSVNNWNHTASISQDDTQSDDSQQDNMIALDNIFDSSDSDDSDDITMNQRDPTEEAYRKLEQRETEIRDWKRFCLNLRNSILEVIIP
tara:strand:+ start:502 stop:1239 length:738 start_codon:yes stop_codon:yes gene_type:complete